MARQIVNNNIATDTWASFIDKANQILYAFSTEILTANSTLANTTGNAQLLGILGANTIAVTNALRGGNATSSAVLPVTSNVTFSGASLNSTANLTQTGISAFVGNTTIGPNSTITAISIVGNSTTTNTSVGGINFYVGANSTFTGLVALNGNTTVIANSILFKSNSTVTAISVAGNSSATNTTISGTTLNITVPTTITANLAVGNTTITGFANVLGTLAVGNTSVNGTLSATANISTSQQLLVTNAASLSNTLNVTGAATLSNTLNVTGAATLSNTLGVTGIATFTSNAVLQQQLLVTNAASLSNTLTVAGNTNLSNNLTVAGFGNVQGTFNTVGAVTLANTLTVTGNTNLSNNFTVSGFANVLGTLSVTSAVSLSNTITITGNSTLSNTLAVIGNANFSNTLNVIGKTTVGVINAVGNATFSTNTTVNALVILANTTTTNTTVGGNDFFVTANATLSGALTTINGVTNATSNATFNANSTVAFIQLRANTTTANTTVGGNLATFTANVVIGTANVGNVGVNALSTNTFTSGPATFTSTANVQGIATFSVVNAAANVVLGASSADKVTIKGSVNTDIIPDTTATRNLGNSTITFANAYVAVVSTPRIVSPTNIQIQNDLVLDVVANTNVGSGNPVVYRFAKASYSSAEFLVQVKNGSVIQTSKMIMATDGASNAQVTTFATIAPSATNQVSPLGTFTANVNVANVELVFVQTIANSAVKVVAHLVV